MSPHRKGRSARKIPKLIEGVARRIYVRDTGALLTSFKHSEQFFDAIEAATDSVINRLMLRQERVFDSSLSTLVQSNDVHKVNKSCAA